MSRKSNNSNSNSRRVIMVRQKERKRVRRMCLVIVRMSWRQMVRAQAATEPIPRLSPVTKILKLSSSNWYRPSLSPRRRSSRITRRRLRTSRSKSVSTSSLRWCNKLKWSSLQSENCWLKLWWMKFSAQSPAKRKSYRKKLSSPKR